MKREASTPKTKSSKLSWPPILTLNYPSGKTGFQVACQIKGKRIREVFPTKGEAEKRAQQIRAMVQSEGAAAFTLAPDVRAEAARCVQKLQPHNATLTETVDYYLKHVIAYRNAPTVLEIVKRMIANAQSAGRRPRTLQDLADRLGRFARTFGNRQLASITLEELQAWLDDPTLAPRSRINYATKLSQLYNYAIRHQWAEVNQSERVTRPSADDTTPETYTVAQAAELLARAADFDLLPFVCLGLFAGLRVAELQRLDWSAVKLAERSVIVGAEVAKKRSRRVVEINGTLAAWLGVCGKQRGPVVDKSNFNKRLRGLAKAAGLDRWPQNALRHSFGSYHLALHGDAVKTAFQMGNSPGVVHSHYKGLVLNGDVQRFWTLQPAADAGGKIVAMKAV